MRDDMDKVIVERPRLNWRGTHKPKGYRQQLRRELQEGGVKREGMKRRWNGGTKALNEHLGPLRRYLDAQVGRPWNAVFAEICAHFNRNSAVQNHVRDHVEDYVVEHVVLINGVPCYGSGRHYGVPLHRLPWRPSPWYVCPRTGLLRRLPPRSRRPRSKPATPPRPDYIRISETAQCRFLNDGWYFITLERLPPFGYQRAISQARDVLLNRPIADLSPELAYDRYGAVVYAVAKRRLARRELKHLPIPMHLWT